MDGRLRKYGCSSPERSKRRGEPPQPQPRHQHKQFQPGMKIPVVYYLCRNRHLEHPHFIEVPMSCHEGLYLRDVINRLKVLRGKGFAALYSWSCKRSYKNGFVWNDLSEDDLLLPASGNEYVLKASELLDTTPPDRSIQSSGRNPKSHKHHHHQHESTTPCRSLDSSPSFSNFVREETPPPPPPPLRIPPPREADLSPILHRPSSSSGNASPESKRNSSHGSGSSPGLSEYKLCKPIGATDASTQTDERNGCEKRSHVRQTTDERQLDSQLENDHLNNPSLRSKESFEITTVDISPPPTSSSTSSSGGKQDTLESLIRADARKMNSFRILEEDDVLHPMGGKLKATNVLMQLITCGSLNVKNDHRFRFVPTYKPRFSHANFPSPMFSGMPTLGELDNVSENLILKGLRKEEKEYFSGSIIETKKHKEEAAAIPTLKRSSSYNADRSCQSPDPVDEKNETSGSARSRCLPRTIKLSPLKKNENMKFPISDGTRISSEAQGCTSKGRSKRYNDPSTGKGPTTPVESFRKDKEKFIKIEERLTSGARVIIQSQAPCEDSEGSNSS